MKWDIKLLHAATSLTHPCIDLKMSAVASRTRLYRSAWAPHFPETFFGASACLCLLPRRLSGAFAEEAEVLQKRRVVLTMSARQCRQIAEGVRMFISASKFWSRPTFWRGHLALSRKCGNVGKCLGMIKTVKESFNMRRGCWMNEPGRVYCHLVYTHLVYHSMPKTPISLPLN